MKRKLALIMMIFALATTSLINIKAQEEVGRNLSEHEEFKDFKFILDPEIHLDGEETETTINSVFQFTSHFSIDEDFFNLIKKGDYLEYDLDPTFDWSNVKDIPFHIPTLDGGELLVFTMKVIDDKIRFQFEDLSNPVFNENHIVELTSKGIDENDDQPIIIKAILDAELIKTPGELIIKHPFSDAHEKPVNIRPTEKGADIEKNGFHTKNSEIISWEIDLNKGYENLTGALVRDQLPSYLIINEESFKIFELKLGHNNQVIDASEALSLSRYKVSFDDGFIIEFGAQDDNKPKRIYFETTIDETILKKDYPELYEQYFNGEGLSVTNTADIKFNNELTKETSKTVLVETDKILEKKSLTELPLSSEHKLKWQLNFNQGNRQLENPVIYDQLSAGMRFLTQEDLTTAFKILNAKGEDISSSYPDFEVILVDDDIQLGQKVEIKFKGLVKEQLFIVYETEITDSFIMEDITVNNKASYNDFSTDSTLKIPERLVNKKANSENHLDKTVNWTIKVNEARYQLKNVVISDWQEGMDLIEDSLVIKDGDKELKKNIDYQITVNSESSGFEITLIGAYEVLSTELLVSYKTNYDYELITKPNNFKNKVNLSWDGESETNIVEKEVEFDPGTTVKNNGKKSGSYNYTKKTITWENILNYNNELGKIHFIDKISQDQKVIDVKIYSYTIIDNKVHRNSEDIADQFLDEISNDIDIVFKEGGQYIVEIITSLDGKIIKPQYQNIAEFAVGDNGKKYELEAKLDIKDGGNHVQKDGHQINNTDKDKVQWQVAINKAQSTLSDVIITDELSSNQKILPESFKLFQVELNEEGYEILKQEIFDFEDLVSLEFAEKTLEEEGELAYIQTFELRFKQEITKHYILEYQTQAYLSTEHEKVNNRIKVSGNNEETISTEESKTVSVTSVEISGGIHVIRRVLHLEKLDAQTKKPIEGVVFDLYLKNKKTQTYELFAEKLRTDREGKISVPRAPLGEYQLVEVLAPEGYVVDNDDEQMFFEFNNEDKDRTFTIYNQPSQLTIRKVDEDDSIVLGSSFELYQLIDGKYVLYEEFQQEQLKKEGYLTLSQLPIGYYQLKEISAENYIVNTETLDFEVRHTDNLSTEFFVDNKKIDEISFINYRGSVQLKKVNEANESLSNVSFALFDENDQLVDNFITDDAGFIFVDNLLPGKYYFKELSNDGSYLLDTTKHEFLISAKSFGQPPIQKLTATNYQAAVSLKKVDEKGNPLAGAQFDLYKADDQALIASKESDDEGVIFIDGLSPGSYYFKETRSPLGYLLNEEKVDFFIKESHDEKYVHEIEMPFKNYQGEVILHKTGNSGQPLAGAIFDLYNESNELVAQSLVTNHEGDIFVKDLQPGNYYFLETQTSEGHILDLNKINFSIDAQAEGKPKVVEVEKQNFKGSVTFKKIDEAGKPVANIKFSLINDQQERIQVSQSDHRGIVLFENISPGKYTIAELDAQDYILNTEKRFFEIKDNMDEEIHITLKDFINYKGRVKLIKLGEEDRPLAGVRFDLLNDQFKIIEKDLVTNEEGILLLDGLSPGSYYFQETASVEGHLVNDILLPFEISSEHLSEPNYVEVLATNYKALVNFKKTDEQGKALPGAIFTLIKEGEELLTLTSNSEGLVTLPSLSPGRYEIKEKLAPKDFLLNTEVISFVVPHQHTNEFRLTLPDFVNYQGSIYLQKIDSEGKVLKGASFSILGPGIDQIIDLKEGEILIEDLAPGKYTISEIKAPEGYQKLEDKLVLEVMAEANGKPEALEVRVVNQQTPSIPQTSVKSAYGYYQYLLLFSFILLLMRLIPFIQEEKKKKI